MSKNIYYSRTALTGGGATALDYIDGSLLAEGDWAFVDVSSTLYVYKLNATSGAAESSPDVISPDTNAGTKRWILKTSYATPASNPSGHIDGLALSHAADTEHDITIAVGECRDSTDAADMVLASALTKQGDAAWAVGTNAGAMDTGSIPASGTLHVWLIKRTDTGVVDALFSISATAPTMPANYDYKRLIGSYRTDASNNIINGDWVGTERNRTFMFDTPILDVSNATPGTNAVTAALSTPGSIITKAFININSVSAYVYASSLNNADMVASSTLAPGISQGVANTAGPVGVFTNTSSQIRYRCNANDGTYISTLGWEQYL